MRCMAELKAGEDCRALAEWVGEKWAMKVEERSVMGAEVKMGWSRSCDGAVGGGEEGEEGEGE